ncbi:nucleoside hydrolase [Pantoea sp. App145]|uniref:nucleoside hydrolase n=1 Tax=Pantoea sp. App145 TaxID=3071567 RepID=UPI003A8131B1
MTEQIIIDTDPGVDDAVAIWLALAAPELEVLGITTVAGNVSLSDVCRNAGSIIAKSGRQDVAIYAGSHGPLTGTQRFGKYAHIGSFASLLKDEGSVAVSAEHAVQFIVRKAQEAARQQRPITLCALGPLTNIALALNFSPEVAKGIKRIVMMGGAFSAMGHRTPWAEFNFYADPNAAARVFRSGIPLVIMPLDMTFQALLTEAHLEVLAHDAGEPGRAIQHLFTTFDRNDPGRFLRDGGPVHDATVIAWLLEPELFQGCEVTVGIATTGETAGYCWADFYHKLKQQANATVMRHIDEQGFHSLLQRVLAVYGSKGEK